MEEEDEGRMDTDLADLCDAYGVEKALADEATFDVGIEGTTVRLRLPPDYPASPPQLTIAAQGSGSAQAMLSYVGAHADEGGRVAVEAVLRRPWTRARTLVEVCDALCVAAKIGSFTGDLLARDFAYRPHDPRHWATPGLQPQRRVTALYDFEAQGDNELAFSKDDVMEVISERNDGWIIAMLNGITGLVPLNHVQNTNSTQ